jgi:hypothetical protein
MHLAAVLHGLLPLRFLLVLFAGFVNREQATVIDYLREENRVLREQLGKRRLQLTDEQRARLAGKAKALGMSVREAVASIVTPETLLRWHRLLVARKVDAAWCPSPRPATGDAHDPRVDAAHGEGQPGLGLHQDRRRVGQRRAQRRADDGPPPGMRSSEFSESTAHSGDGPTRDEDRYWSKTVPSRVLHSAAVKVDRRHGQDPTADCRDSPQDRDH